MKTKKVAIELIRDPDLGGFTACVPHIPVFGEGETEEEAIADLEEGLRGYIETFGLDAVQDKVGTVAVRHIDLDLADLANG